MIAAAVVILAAALALLTAAIINLLRETAAAWRRRLVIAAVLLPIALVVLATQFQVALPWWVVLAVGVLTTLVLWRSRRSAVMIVRWAKQNIRRKGVASTIDIIRWGSAMAMRRTTTVLRPSTADLTRWQRARLSTDEVGVRLVKVGAIHVWASIREAVAIIGGPGGGKTGWMAARVIDFPGADVNASTRTDLMELTRPLREQVGPVYVFNPGGLGGLDSTVTFPPLTGCADPVTATERATDMIPESEDNGRHAFWEGRAREVFAGLMHAAALGGRDMHDVAGWVANPKGSAQQVTYLLGQSQQPAFATAFEQFIGTNTDTLTSITASISPALKWLTSPSAVAAAKPGGTTFDVAALLRDRGTVYMLGRDEAHTSPLLAALTGYIAREGRRLAAGGRLDPPLGLHLDEASRTVTVPLPDWTGDFGGTGIHICLALQSRADLIERWGKTGAARIINNLGARILLGGTADPEDLDMWSKLAGDRDAPLITYGRNGRVVARTTRPVAVLAPAQLANLPRWHAVVYRRDLRPAIGRVSMAWDRPDVQAAAKVARRVTTPTRTSATTRTPARVSSSLPGAAAPSPDRAVTRVG